MSWWAWMLLGAGALLLVSVPIGMVMDEQVRRDVGAALIGAIALPFMVPATLLIWGLQRGDFGGRRLSNRTLARFADQRQREDVKRHAWMFNIAGRGVILVRKAPRPSERPADASGRVS